MFRSNSPTLCSTAVNLVLFVDELSITRSSFLEMAEHKFEIDVIDFSEVLIMTLKLLLYVNSSWWEFLTTSIMSLRDLEMGGLPKVIGASFSGSGPMQMESRAAELPNSVRIEGRGGGSSS